ncbi:MAG TPA: hypothetical protein VGH11_15730, partial [Jatrophihabitans sp.]
MTSYGWVFTLVWTAPSGARAGSPMRVTAADEPNSSEFIRETRSLWSWSYGLAIRLVLLMASDDGLIRVVGNGMLNPTARQGMPGFIPDRNLPEMSHTRIADCLYKLG